MTFHKYTQCYKHTPGDKPFNETDLVSFSAGAGSVGIIGAIASFLVGIPVLGYAFIGVGYAMAIAAVANEWLYHRLVCVSTDGKPVCAVGKVLSEPEIGSLGEFDNDEFFDLLLMPHRPNDDYKVATDNYKTHKPGISQDNKTEKTPANDIYLDGFQGEALMKPSITDLPYKLDRAKLHCEAEGNFWVKMKEWAIVFGVLVAVATAAGAAAGAALGCALGSFFGPLGCAIGAFIGALLGGAVGAVGAHFIASWLASMSDPGDVNDANVGDTPLGPLRVGDKVVVYGEHVYDGFHEGWHELHPLMAIMRVNEAESDQYLEWDPDYVSTKPVNSAEINDSDPSMPANLKTITADDIEIGLQSDKFRQRALWWRDKWCSALTDAYNEQTRTHQLVPENRWTIHPVVDGCLP